MKSTSSLVAGGLLIVTFLPGALPSTSPAAIVTIPASKDAMIFGTAAGADTGNASGKGPGMFAGADGSLNRKRSLMQFDIAGSLRAGAQITDVTLTLYLGQIAGGGTGGTGSNYPSRTIDLFALQQDWGEGNSGFPTSPTIGGSGQGYARITGDSSWDYAFFDAGDTSTGKWNAGGPDLHGGNFAATASASSTFAFPFTVGGGYTWTSAGLVADVQQWLDNPSSNHGWLLKAMNGTNSTGGTVSLEDSSQSFLGFWTKDGAAANNNPAIAPALTITYDVPEPVALALLGVPGVLGMSRRRSRLGS